ncbi:MAG: invasion associated locus B family protein [Neomegalonema sp.]|nr:invasion associated locus B family protein [Neomegalonema sp.]
MMLNRSLRALMAAALALPLAAGVAAAQDKKEAPGKVAVKVREKHGDWEIRCVSDKCVMAQTFKDANKRPVLDVTIRKLKSARKTKKGAVILGVAHILTPLKVQIPEGLGLKIDDGPARSAPYVVCSQVGCLSRPPLTADLVDELKNGKKADFLTVIEIADKGKIVKRVVVTPISLTGFTKAFEAL